MGFSIRNGTPVGSESLCKTCTYVHMQSGYRESEELIFCNFGNLRLVPFPVKECTDYTNRTLPTWEQMEKLALDVKSAPNKRVKGFSVEMPLPEEVAS
jgi:hypothetical protein